MRRCRHGGRTAATAAASYQGWGGGFKRWCDALMTESNGDGWRPVRKNGGAQLASRRQKNDDELHGKREEVSGGQLR
jgi:hypothetical protein